MPPRIRCPSAQLAAVDLSTASKPHTQAAPFVRSFSTTSCRQKHSLGRRRMFAWLDGSHGSGFREAGRSPKYLGQYEDQPFPNNPLFRSQPVLSESTKELIWDKVTQRGESLKAVSAEMGVDVRRVTAVVRLKEVEKQWERDGKKLATPYAKAVMNMLPKTTFVEGEKNEPHEPINEVHVHRLTMQQLFVPVSESRQFTREDAAKAFHDTMLSADARSPQPQLINMERDMLEGKSREDSLETFREATQKEEDKVARKIAKEQQLEEEQTMRVKSDRYEFRFKEIDVQDAGRDGKSRKATGWRYGVPHNDRKRGLIKIPTSVP